MKKKFINRLLITFLTLCTISCKKFVEIGPPKTELVSSEAFKQDATATSAVFGIYSNMQNNFQYENSGITIYSGLSADELRDFSLDAEKLQFQNNGLVPTNSIVGEMWMAAYKNLVLINTCIEGLQESTTLTPAVKEELLGECRFSRAFVNFYLVNLWGNVPLVTSSDWRKNAVIAQSTQEEVYAAIIKDLKEAQSQLSVSYPTAERTRPNKWTATALLARTYLFTKDYANAEIQASAVIESGLYTRPLPDSRLPELNQIFLKESSEAIWQLELSQNQGFATREGLTFNGYGDEGEAPAYTISESLLHSFETGDNRKTIWINQKDYQDQSYPYPFKYTDRGTYGATTAKEYYMMFRLSEQYMIRAEARVQLNKLTDAMDDIDIIRNRAGLGSVHDVILAVTKENLLTAIENENRHEFFAEWGHRWLDLKRTGRLDAVMSAEKPSWKPTAAIFPIPQNDLDVNKNLVQNTGYK